MRNSKLRNICGSLRKNLVGPSNRIFAQYWNEEKKKEKVEVSTFQTYGTEQFRKLIRKMNKKTSKSNNFSCKNVWHQNFISKSLISKHVFAFICRLLHKLTSEISDAKMSLQTL